MGAASTTSSIVLCICTYDRYDLLPKAIESATRQNLPAGSYNVLVIDNSPNSERAEAFGKRFRSVPNLEYVVEKAPGLSNARNLGARLSKAPIIAFMDDDAIASPVWAEEILKAFDKFGRETMIVGGRVDPIWSKRRPPWVHDLDARQFVDYRLGRGYPLGDRVRMARRHEYLVSSFSDP